MTREDIIRMALEAGMTIVDNTEISSGIQINRCSYFDIKRFAALVAAAEREAAEERVTDLFADMETPYLPDIVAAIRARKENT